MEFGRGHVADNSAVIFVFQFQLVDVDLETVVLENIKSQHWLVDIAHYEPLGKAMTVPEVQQNVTVPVCLDGGRVF